VRDDELAPVRRGTKREHDSRVLFSNFSYRL
jgi:hypothetical protein